MTIEIQTDVLIIGGGTGGCAAAIAAAELGYRVVLTEPTAWVGGQLTSQAVPTDEHPWIEHTGATRRYRRFRSLVREYYRQHYPLTAKAKADPYLNPGLGTVSPLCCEPKAALAALHQMMAWLESSGRLRVLHHARPVAVEANGDHVRSVTLEHRERGERICITADYVLDATELGDLLPLSGAEYVTGAESRDDTHEPHAVAGPAQPHNHQAISWCFHLSFDDTPGASHVIERPAQYDRWRSYVPPVAPAWTGPLLSWTDPHPHTLRPRHNSLFPEDGPDAPTHGRPFWRFRRVLAAEHFEPSLRVRDVTLVNWPMIDFIGADIIDQPEAVVAAALDDAKQLSLSFLYWIQTEAPRAGGRTGYPELYLRPDVAGTSDGLAMAPYIRESRRICARFTVTENHVGLDARRRATGDEAPHAAQFGDSVGIGAYRIDLHPSTGGDNYIDIPSLPFQIPLGALVPVRLRNLLPACKNIGTTHITNGCYRLHPVEWNVGESAGLLAAFCLEHRTEPHAVLEDKDLLEGFQRLLVGQGIELAWPEQYRRSSF